jgi:hypothetical protein
MKIIILILLYFPLNITAKETLTIAVFDWCPQMCFIKEKNTPGFLVEMVNLLLPNYNIIYRKLPGNRAYAMAKEGKVDGILGVSKQELPKLIYTNNFIGEQEWCFWVDKKNSWSYQNRESLKQSKKIGVISSLNFDGEVGKFRKNHPEKFKFIVPSQKLSFIDRCVKELEVKSISSFIFDYNSVQYKKKSNNHVKSKLKSAGCFNSQKIYLGLNSKTPKKSEKIKKEMDINYSHHLKTGKIKKILKMYNLKLKL